VAAPIVRHRERDCTHHAPQLDGNPPGTKVARQVLRQQVDLERRPAGMRDHAREAGGGIPEPARGPV
jgi:hypothetical protein